MLSHGILLVDKPIGVTSHDVVASLRKILNTKAIGHTGTLDPLASGLMACLVNEGTKISSYLLEGDKAYTVHCHLGVETDTLDITGEVLQRTDVPFMNEVFKKKIVDEALQLQGEFDWDVPLFSAVRVKGKKLYEHARAGETSVERPIKKMRFWDIQVDQIQDQQIVVSLQCSKGSYIRKWVHELGKKLGCGATMIALRRTVSTPYNVSQASSLTQIQEQITQMGLESFYRQSRSFVPLSDALPNYKRIIVKGMDASLLSNGQISHSLRNLLTSVFEPGQDEMVQVIEQRTGELKALVGIELNRGFIIRRVFRY